MDQAQLEVFIKSVVDYFDKMTDSPAQVGVPFLKDDKKNILLAYTGVIGISGAMRGAIYLTTSENFLGDLLDRLMPGLEKSEQQISSMVGELANTISGNAQEALGSEYHISVPIILTSSNPSENSSLEIQASSFVIPLRWKTHDAFLVVGLEKKGF